MSILLSTPDTGDLDEIIRTLGEWRREQAPMQLHPGDIGFYWQYGPKATAAALRTWSRQGRILAVGLLDGPELARLAITPQARDDEELARHMADDVTRPEHGILTADKAHIEALWQGRFRQLLQEEGWEPDEPWIPMVRNLSEPVTDSGLRIEVVGPQRPDDRIAVHRGIPRLEVQRTALAHHGRRDTVRRCPMPCRIQRPQPRCRGHDRVVSRSR